ncbi:MAG: hypothetical protein A2293_10700 [Elusimicrobia bacterium RIFOXYB2_FULL_49_7]|nr:MAG: hypothetical protein A2293_10700 [Elusimicrobia bacterium RIFOXYB2_FULL_49_7]
MRILGLFMFLIVSQTVLSLTLSESQNLLFQQNKDIAVIEAQISQDKAAVSEAWSAFQPTVALRGQYGYQSEVQTLELPTPIPSITTRRDMGDHDKTEWGADIQIPLFTGLGRYYNVKSRDAFLQSEQMNLEAIKNSLSFRLGQLFFALELATQRTQTQEALIRQFVQYRDQTVEQHNAGVVAATRVSEAEARLATAKAERVAMADQIDSLRLEIGQLIGRPDTVMVFDFANAAPDSAESARLMNSRGARDRPEMAAYDCSSRLLEYRKKGLTSQLLPTLSASAGLRYGNPGLSLSSDEFMSWQVAGLSLNWTVYDGMKTLYQKRQVEQSLVVTRLRKEKESEQWTKALSQARLKWIQANDQLKAARLAESASEEYASDLKNGLDAGTVTSLEYLNALSGLAQARWMVHQARFQVNSAALAIRYASGTPLRF